MNRSYFLLRNTAAVALTTTTFLNLSSPAMAQAKLVLADPTVTPRILIAPNSFESEKYAAQELAEYIGKMTGKKIETVSSAESVTATAQSPLIVVGRHPINKDLQPEKLELEEAVISIEPNRVRIVGGAIDPTPASKNRTFVRDRGTLYGAYSLLDTLGVRWYRPDEWGEFVPQKKTITLDQGKKNFKPAYKYRNINTIYRWFKEQTDDQWMMAERWAVRNFQNTNFRYHPQFGGVYSFQISHSYGSLMPRFATHPEYYSLINGKRDPKGQPCLGNPDVVEFMAKKVIEKAKELPQTETVSVSPNDGTAWCECERCRALDDPNLLAPNGGEARLGKASMTNRVTYAHNIIAKRLNEEVPGKKIAWYAYLSTSEVPTKITHYEPNMVVAPTTMAAAYGTYSRLLDDPTASGNVRFKSILEGWSKRTPMVTREYWSGGCWYGPLPMLTMLKDRLSNYRKYNVQGVINEANPSWGPQTDLHYFASRLMWNPDLDLDKELVEFCNNYYGPAGQTMLQYHRLLEEASLKGPAWFFSGRFIDRLFVDEELTNKMGQLIAKAKLEVGTQEPYARRFKGAEAGYEVARVRSLVERLKREKNPVQAVAEWDKLEKFVKSDTNAEIFNSGASIAQFTWRVMTEQAGIGGMRNQIKTLNQNTNAALLENISDNWKFVTDPDNVGLDKGFQATSFKDKKWMDFHTNSHWQAQGIEYQGTAWYRKQFQLKEKHKDAKYGLFFGAVDGDAVVYVNGKEVGKHLLTPDGDGWNDFFTIDVTNAVKKGKNTAAVQVKKDKAIGGITQGVVLMRL
jgi:hypothetical protein